jgi:hypothetical protein
MKVHAREKQDGLAEKIQALASVAMVCPLIASEDYMTVDQKVIARILANSPSNPDQKDLYYLNAILVSTGWNKNTDVFVAEHVWAARSTPTDKQFNFMHNETDIIGHITGSIVLDRQGNVIADTEKAPEEFDIVTSAVIYRAISDPEKRFEREKIIAEIEDGKWAVSMEALFNDFDYAIITPDGEHRIVARDEESAFLTKHLKAYGGKGEFDGFLLGRILKNIVFSGKGLVDNPAGPRSIILDKNVNPFKAVSSLDIKAITQTESKMNEDMLKQEVADLKRELAEFKASTAKAEEVARAEQNAQAEAKAAELTETIATKEKDVDAVTKERDAAVADSKKLQGQLDTVEAQVKTSNRKSDLVEAGLKGDEVDETLAKFADATDEVFVSVVELLKAQKEAEANFDRFKNKDKDKDDDDDKDKDKDKDKKDKDKKKADALKDAADDVDEVEADEKEGTLKDDADEDKAPVLANVIAWMEADVLKTTANLKD